MSMLNPIGNNFLQSADLGAAYNTLPVNYGLVNGMGLFSTTGLMTNVVTVEEDMGRLVVVQNQSTSGPYNPNQRGRRKSLTFQIPYYPLQEKLTAIDIQNIRAFGSSNELQAYSSVTNQRLQTMRRKHEITREMQKVNACTTGNILDAEGSSLLNLYTVYGVTQKVVDFVLGTATTDTLAKAGEVTDHIVDNLGGDVATGYTGLCSRTFYNKLFGHDFTRGTFQFSNIQSTVLRSDMGSSATPYGDINWLVYIGNARKPSDNSSMSFIPDGDAYVFPTGTLETFAEFVGPANFIDAANTLGQVFYARQALDGLGLGVTLHAEMTALSLCLRPQVVVRCHSSN